MVQYITTDDTQLQNILNHEIGHVTFRIQVII